MGEQHALWRLAAPAHVVCFSGGHSSALVAIEVVRRYGRGDVVLLNHDAAMRWLTNLQSTGDGRGVRRVDVTLDPPGRAVGLAIGGAQVSEKHTNFLINTGEATSAEIEALGEEVRKRVKQMSGVELEWEIKRIGRP